MSGKGKKHAAKARPDRTGGGEAGRRPRPPGLPAELADAAAPAPSEGPRPAGQRLYDMPYSAVAPRLINPALGLHNLVARAGHNAAYEIDVTLLDAPDHRLIRSGVLLAHRVLDGRGEWFLTAPDWQPLLPRDRIELMGHSDLPQELADLIRPLRRRAPLGPVAALRCERREFALRDDAGTTLGLLRDDKVTVRRGGLTTARYREVMVTPLGPGLDDGQAAWLDRALLGVGSTQVTRFPRLVSRLGAPATGPSDVPVAPGFDPETSFQRFVGQLLGLRLRLLVEADLAVRGGDLRAADRLADQARQLGTELEGLSLAVASDWLDDLRDELRWLVAEGDPDGPSRLPSRLRSERYLALLDRLVSAARAPQLGEVSGAPVRAELMTLLASAVSGITAAVADVDVDIPGPGWVRVGQAVERAVAMAVLAAPLAPRAAAVLTKRLTGPRALLAGVAAEPDAQEARAGAETLSPAEAFTAGRVFEQRTVEARRARVDFLTAWSKAERKLARVPLGKTGA